MSHSSIVDSNLYTNNSVSRALHVHVFISMDRNALIVVVMISYSRMSSVLMTVILNYYTTKKTISLCIFTAHKR